MATPPNIIARISRRKLFNFLLINEFIIYTWIDYIDFSFLYPLIEETARRVQNNSPFLTQTGPAMRDDIFTLNRHLQALNSVPNLKYIYLKLTESIIKHHGKR